MKPCDSVWNVTYSYKTEGHQVRKCDFQAILLIFLRFEGHDTKHWPMV